MILLGIGMLVFTNNNRVLFPLKRLEVIAASLVDSRRNRKQAQLYCSTESLTKLKRDKGIIGTAKYVTRICGYTPANVKMGAFFFFFSI